MFNPGFSKYNEFKNRLIIAFSGKSTYGNHRLA